MAKRTRGVKKRRHTRKRTQRGTGFFKDYIAPTLAAIGGVVALGGTALAVSKFAKGRNLGTPASTPAAIPQKILYQSPPLPKTGGYFDDSD